MIQSLSLRPENDRTTSLTRDPISAEDDTCVEWEASPQLLTRWGGFSFEKHLRRNGTIETLAASLRRLSTLFDGHGQGGEEIFTECKLWAGSRTSMIFSSVDVNKYAPEIALEMELRAAVGEAGIWGY